MHFLPTPSTHLIFVYTIRFLTAHYLTKLQKSVFAFNTEQKSQKQIPTQDLNLLRDVPTSHIENAESETRWF